MSQQPRDVPPPRPVGGTPVEGEIVGADSGLGAAARALADAVAGLLGRDEPGVGTRGRDGGGPGRTAAGARAATGVLADVVSAVTAAARDARAGSGRGSSAGTDDRGGTTRGGSAPSGVLGDLLDAAAPRLPIRDGARLRRAHPGASDAEIADALVARAARLTGGVGAATGGLAAAQWFAPPSLVAVPLELGAQTVLVAAVEVVLVGELHELAGRPAPGDARARAGAYLASWSTQRAVGSTSSGGLFAALSTAGTAALRRRITRRLARSTTSVAPLLVGAALAARGNRKATGALADRLRADLGLPPSAPGA
ncbi:hypothetical protein O2W15_22995 [Modestobacter sp. VKM Ac-2979]|uniref:hypothetical protein n=1 Tax=unclassified Modestobacter TaxID=2643866 RepID=UPI0022AB611D|nr:MULTISPECIES: hypothetical protein [unclassified Modestobacter]MCZ2814307.1 hypothetical protein [Modestobacter sp. VKM Ac-2979]MCZ2844001.1 hypothetical protein [Modestobacter sp. VKM Ac-2980]